MHTLLTSHFREVRSRVLRARAVPVFNPHAVHTHLCEWDVL